MFVLFYFLFYFFFWGGRDFCFNAFLFLVYFCNKFFWFFIADNVIYVYTYDKNRKFSHFFACAKGKTWSIVILNQTHYLITGMTIQCAVVILKKKIITKQALKEHWIRCCIVYSLKMLYYEKNPSTVFSVIDRFNLAIDNMVWGSPRLLYCPSKHPGKNQYSYGC